MGVLGPLTRRGCDRTSPGPRARGEDRTEKDLRQGPWEVLSPPYTHSPPEDVIESWVYRGLERSGRGPESRVIMGGRETEGRG